MELFFLLLELGRRRRGGLVGVLLAFRVGVRRGEALRQALEAAAERRDVGLLLRRELGQFALDTCQLLRALRDPFSFLVERRCDLFSQIARLRLPIREGLRVDA